MKKRKTQLSFFKAIVKSYWIRIANIPLSGSEIIRIDPDYIFWDSLIPCHLWFLFFYYGIFFYCGIFIHYSIAIGTGFLVTILIYIYCPGLILNEWIRCSTCVPFTLKNIDDPIITSLQENRMLVHQRLHTFCGLYSAKPPWEASRVALKVKHILAFTNQYNP